LLVPTVASAPIAVAWSRLLTVKFVLLPKTVLFVPVMLTRPDEVPTNVFPLPEVVLCPAKKPKKALFDPDP